MSIQWTFIAGYLYFEIALVMLMILPIFSPRRWNQFFKSRLFSMFRENVAVYFYVFIGVLALFLIDAVREIRKYSNVTDVSHTHLATEMKTHVKLFRAQRNFYIIGFAIFLTFVIRRLITMLIIQDELKQKAEKIIKQAEETVKQAKTSILANTLQSEELQHYDELNSKLEETKILLKLEKDRVKLLEDDVKMWQQKCEEAIASKPGKGDE
ncbi:B-cell receptor-associated protein 31-like [Bombyx mandarina]|uniref:Endoplasmic reticulum transmembrane protein n=1 Tax=Bombyx mandarina TaxID=7092 RepID=A0A6J2JDF4_BOMMA|nr:B-cell receptor-associated protein 31-like [Bombyx mandarina]